MRILLLIVAAWGIMGGWPLQAAPAPTKAERTAAAWACQMRAIRSDGTMPEQAPCVCRARAGLPESARCKADRAKAGAR
jgi:hypothetical protein